MPTTRLSVFTRALALALLSLCVCRVGVSCRQMPPSVIVTQCEVEGNATQFGKPGVRVAFTYDALLGAGDASRFRLFAVLAAAGEWVGQPVVACALVPTGHAETRYTSPQPVSVFLPYPAGPPPSGLQVLLLASQETPTAASHAEVYTTYIAGSSTEAQAPAPVRKGSLRPFAEQRFLVRSFTVNDRPTAESLEMQATQLRLRLSIGLETHPDDLEPPRPGIRTDAYEFAIRLRRLSDGQVLLPAPGASVSAWVPATFYRGEGQVVFLDAQLEGLALNSPTPCMLEVAARGAGGQTEFPVVAQQRVSLAVPNLRPLSEQRVLALAPRLVPDHTATGARALLVQFKAQPRYSAAELQNPGGDFTAADLVLHAEVRNPQGQVVYSTAVPPASNGPYQTGQLLTNPRPQLVSEVALVMPYSQMTLPTGTHELEVVAFAQNRTGTVRLPECIRQRVVVSIPRMLECTLNVTEVQAEQIYDYDIGRGLPDTYWQVQVGNARVFRSAEATNQFVGIPGRATFRICPGDQVTLGVYDSDVTSFDDVIGTQRLPALTQPQQIASREYSFERVKRITYSLTTQWLQ